MLQTSAPTRYWVGIRIPVPDGEQPHRLRTTLLAASTSLGGGGLFVDVRPLLFAALGAVLLSALPWVPFVPSLTRSIGELTGVTERIAGGQFDIQVRAKSRDELGRLGHAVNRLAGRLGGFLPKPRSRWPESLHRANSRSALVAVQIQLCAWSATLARTNKSSRPKLSEAFHSVSFL